MTATPPEGIDRDALRLLAYEQWLWSDERPTPEQVDAYVDRILALQRPVEGVTLTPEEAREALAPFLARVDQYRRTGDVHGPEYEEALLAALGKACDLLGIYT